MRSELKTVVIKYSLGCVDYGISESAVDSTATAMVNVCSTRTKQERIKKKRRQFYCRLTKKKIKKVYLFR